MGGDANAGRLGSAKAELVAAEFEEGGITERRALANFDLDPGAHAQLAESACDRIVSHDADHANDLAR
jgi:hypothetical protein